MASFHIYLIYEFRRGIVKATSVYLLIAINVFFQMFNGLIYLTSRHSCNSSNEASYGKETDQKHKELEESCP